MIGIELLVGGIARLLPELTKVWNSRNEMSHEERMLALQLEVDKARAAMEIAKIESAGNLEVQKATLAAIQAAQTQQMGPFARTGVAIVDALGGLADVLSKFVRPVLTYWYCVAGYGAYKAAVYYGLLSSGIAWDSAILQAWTTDDYMVMQSIIGFWFVDRAIRHQRG